MSDAIVSIGAGRAQLPLIETARRMGYAVVGVDRDAEAAGLRSCYAYVRASTHDPDEVLRALGSLRPGLRVRAVATQSSGPPVVTAARVAHERGLPGLDPGLAARAVTKAGTMELASAAGVAVPRHATTDDASLLAVLGLAPPLVVKPSLTAVGKRAVRLVRDASELEESLAAARAASLDGEVEVESFEPGRDVVLAAHFAGGEVRPFALFDEHTSFGTDGAARGDGFTLPSTCSGSREGDAVVRAAARLLTGHPFGAGLAFLTFRVLAGREPVLLEVHFDLGGDLVSDVLFGGAGLIETTLDLLAGRPPGGAPADLRPTGLRFLREADVARGGSALATALRALDGVVEVRADRPASNAPGDARVGYVLLHGATPEDVSAAGAAVQATLGRPASEAA